MNEITLQLRFAPRIQRQECARLLMGNNPRAWLDELIGWNIPLSKVRLCPLPSSRSDNRCSGALAIFGSDRVPAEVGRAPRYGRIAQRVYVPVDSELSIDLSVSDWQELLTDDTAVYVWHPQLGVVAFNSNEVLQVADLLSGPHFTGRMDAANQREAMDWGCARDGVIYLNRISALRALMPPSTESMLEDLRDGIGTHQKLPSNPWPGSESLKSIGKLAAAGVLAPLALLAKAANILSSLAPKTGVTGSPAQQLGPGPIGQFFNWLKEKYSSARTASGSASNASNGGIIQSAMQGLKQAMKWSADLLSARQREVNRLLKMLQDDPDEGLKYALPMGGEPGRGIAPPPSSSLMKRSLDFSLSGHGGGAAADIWSLPLHTQIQLSSRYRELAAREIQLGRYRRAAYIFAELLGDLNSAAHALATGRYYREAAVIYRDKLKRPLDAADCLEKGGLLQDAISLYRQLGQHEKVGDLYLRLAETEQAENAFEEASRVAVGRRDFLEAARILEQKCGSTSRALNALEQGWPASNQARKCLESSFELLARQGQHDESMRKFQILRSELLSPQRCVDAVEVLTDVATRTPHAASRASAADTVRVMVSAALKGKIASREQLTNAISRLAPEDRLLSRDCQRAGKSSGSTTRTKRPRIRHVKTIHVIGFSYCTNACETDEGFYLAGWSKNGEAIVARAAWNDSDTNVMLVHSETHRRNMPDHLLICKDPSEHSVVIASPGGRVFDSREFSATDAHRNRETVVTPNWLPKTVSAMAVSPIGTFYTFQLVEMLITSYSVQRHPIINLTVEAPILGQTFNPHETFPMFAAHDACYLGIHESLYWTLAGQSKVQVLNFRHPIRHLVGSTPRTAPRLAVLFNSGAYVYWTEKPGMNESSWFAADLDSPRAVFLSDGRLVLLGESSGKRVWRICSISNDTINTLFEMPCDMSEEIVALLRGSQSNQVALCTKGGVVHIYEFA